MELYKGPNKEPGTIKAILDANDVRITSTEVEPDHETDWKHGRFSVTVQVNSKPFQTFYSMGEGHKRLFRETLGGDMEQFHWFEKLGIVRTGWDLQPKTHIVERIGYPSPERADVLYSLVSDASIYDSCQDIDDYASEYCEGMKFRKVMDTWDEIRRVHEFITDAFGTDLPALQEAFQDY